MFKIKVKILIINNKLFYNSKMLKIYNKFNLLIIIINKFKFSNNNLNKR